MTSNDTQMSITINTNNLETLARVFAALAGGNFNATASVAPAAVHTPAMSTVAANAAAIKAAKAEKKETPAPEPASAAASATHAPSGVAAAAQTAPASAEVPDEATLTAAANAAIGKLGPGAQAKIKDHIAYNYTKDDGSPAGLRTVRADQRAALLADLQAFANGSRTI